MILAPLQLTSVTPPPSQNSLPRTEHAISDYSTSWWSPPHQSPPAVRSHLAKRQLRGQQSRDGAAAACLNHQISPLKPTKPCIAQIWDSSSATSTTRLAQAESAIEERLLRSVAPRTLNWDQIGLRGARSRGSGAAGLGAIWTTCSGPARQECGIEVVAFSKLLGEREVG
jgi:hypothetical protein